MSRLTIPQRARAVYTWDGWTLYELPHAESAHSILWYPFKLMLPPSTPARWRQRRAFYLTWNPLELRVRKDAQRRALEVELPDLYMRVELVLALSYGPEWLVRVRGLSESDILAERARLEAAAAARRRTARATKAKSPRDAV